jgi:hypothetical protein
MSAAARRMALSAFAPLAGNRIKPPYPTDNGAHPDGLAAWVLQEAKANPTAGHWRTLPLAAQPPYPSQAGYAG